jgi:polyisoprenoid-binding protein YceI
MTWQIDSVHSQIQFKVRHMMVSWVRGCFEKFNGTINLDEHNTEKTTVNIMIDVASIYTHQADRDAHLRGADFLDAFTYPKIYFVSRKVKQTSANTAKLTGDLTIRDVANEVTLDITYSGQEKSPFGPTLTAGFCAETVISRKQWGLTYNLLMESGGVALGDEIYISIDLELNKAVEVEQMAIATG